MKHEINETYPDETHYTIAVMCEEEELKLKRFLEENKSEEIINE